MCVCIYISVYTYIHIYVAYLYIYIYIKIYMNLDLSQPAFVDFSHLSRGEGSRHPPYTSSSTLNPPHRPCS